MARGVKLSCDAREILYRVYIYFTLEAEKFETDDLRYFGKVRYRVAQATGVSKKTIYNLIAAKGKPGSETFTKALEGLKRSSEIYKLSDEEDDTSDAKKRKINECQTNVEEVVTPEPTIDLTVDTPEPPIPNIHSKEINIQTKENPGFVKQKKLYVRTTTVYTTKAGPAISKMNDIEKILGIKQPNVVSESNVTLIQALPNPHSTQKVLKKATEKTKFLPEMVFVKAKSSGQNIGHTSGSTLTTVHKKPERTIIKVHRIRQKNAEKTTTPECQNIVLKPIVTPDFIKLEAQYKSAESEPVMSTDNVKVEIKTEMNDINSY